LSALTLEEIDLASLVESLRVTLGASLEASYLRGKTVLRDAIVARLDCSEYEAEELVETLELQRYISFPHLPDDTHPSGRSAWRIGRRH
jgi:hypothetical protein